MTKVAHLHVGAAPAALVPSCAPTAPATSASTALPQLWPPLVMRTPLALTLYYKELGDIPCDAAEIS
jgi:hypothetical protein